MKQTLTGIVMLVVAAGLATNCGGSGGNSGGSPGSDGGNEDGTTISDSSGSSSGADSGSSGGADAASDAKLPDSGAACVISGTTFASGAANPTNACKSCQPSVSTSAWSDVSDGTTCGTGGICHTGACVSGCEIGSVYYATNAPDPTNACQTCQPSTSTSAWTGVADGTGCGNGQVCASGTCGTQCDIGGTIYPSGAANPTNACQTCQPGTSTTAWTTLANGTSCALGEVCNTGSCGSGCYIGGTVYASGAANPTNACQTCQPGTSTTAWTGVADGTSCSGSGKCSSGSCAMITAIQVTPGNPVDFIVGGAPVVQAFHAIATYSDSTMQDVTASAAFTVGSPTLGSFSGASFTSALSSGYTSVTATVGSVNGSTVLTLVVEQPGDLYFVAPFDAATSPASAPVTFGTTIQQVDVGFILDTTGDTAGNSANLQTSFSGLATYLATKVPSLAFGVGDFKSWPCGADGNLPDYPWSLDNRIVTVSTSAGRSQIQNVLNGLTASGGGDAAEPAFDALYFAATGATSPNCAGGTIAAFNAATAPGSVSGEMTGSLGGMGFRPGSLPVVTLMTTAEFHDEQDPGDTTFSPPGSTAHGHTSSLQALSALQSVGARFVGVAGVGGGASFSPIFTGAPVTANNWEPRPQMLWLAENTGSTVPVASYGGACGSGMCCTGESGAGEAPDGSGNCPLVYRVAAGGSGTGTVLADALTRLVTASTWNDGSSVIGKATDDATPTNPLPGTHTTADFLVPSGSNRGISPTSSVPAVGTTGGPASIDASKGTFVGTPTGPTLTFTVRLYNDFIPQISGVPQFFSATVDAVADGSVLLGSHVVHVIVPPQ